MEAAYKRFKYSKLAAECMMTDWRPIYPVGLHLPILEKLANFRKKEENWQSPAFCCTFLVDDTIAGTTGVASWPRYPAGINIYLYTAIGDCWCIC